MVLCANLCLNIMNQTSENKLLLIVNTMQTRIKTMMLIFTLTQSISYQNISIQKIACRIYNIPICAMWSIKDLMTGRIILNKDLTRMKENNQNSW